MKRIVWLAAAGPGQGGPEGVVFFKNDLVGKVQCCRNFLGFLPGNFFGVDFGTKGRLQGQSDQSQLFDLAARTSRVIFLDMLTPTEEKQWFHTDWTRAALDGKKVEFQLAPGPFPAKGFGSFKLSQHTDGKVKILIILPDVAQGPTFVTSQIILSEHAASLIKPHPDKTRADFQLLAE